MSLTYKRLTAGVAIAGIAVLSLGAAGYLAGARINTTQSIPVGLYWTSRQPLVKGAYVLFCPPEAKAFAVAKARGYIGAGFCPGGYGFMMKRVVATNGDTVSIADDGVRVNTVMMPLSVPLRKDKAGRQLLRFGSSRFRLYGSKSC